VYELFLSNGKPFIQLTNDGNLLPQALSRQSIRLGVAERVDVIVDFRYAHLGDKLYLQNRLEQLDGRGPTGKIIAPTNLVEFRVVSDATVSTEVSPGKPLLALPDRRAPVQSRRWDFGRSGGEWVINGELFDPDVIRAQVQQNTAELWTFTGGNGWQHPVHIHFEEFQILSRNGKTQAVPIDEQARKDIIRIGDSAVGTDNTEKAQIFMQFRNFHKNYPLHCHNVVHEDHAMMVRFEVVDPKG